MNRLGLRSRSLIHTKRRLTARLIEADHRDLDRGRAVREKRWCRARIYRIDKLLERRGLLATNTWYHGARKRPGLNANYRRGRVLKRCVKEHYTVGRNSLGLIRDRGLAQFLVNRDGTIDQCAPADAVCSDSCEWAIEGPGIENECMDRGQLNAAMIHANAGLHRWLHGTYGYPKRWYGGARRLSIGNPEGYGFVNHGSLVHRKCDQHTDGLTPAEWEAIAREAWGSDKADDQEEDDVTNTGYDATGQWWAINGLERKKVTAGDAKTIQQINALAAGDAKKTGNFGRIPDFVLRSTSDVDAPSTVALAIVTMLKKLGGWLLRAVPATWRKRGGTPPDA